MPLHERVARGHFTTKFSSLGHSVPQSPHKEARIRACGGERGGEPLLPVSPDGRASPAQKRPRSAGATRAGGFRRAQ